MAILNSFLYVHQRVHRSLGQKKAPYQSPHFGQPHHPFNVSFHPVQVMHARLYTKASWREASNLMISTVPCNELAAICCGVFCGDGDYIMM